MKQNIFKRTEQKYILNEEEYKIIMKKFRKYLKKDKFYKSEIHNIYFDNDNNDLIITSLEKPLFKQKIRVRCYGNVNDNNIVFLEMKQKYKGTVYKRRGSLKLIDLNKYLENNIMNSDNQILKEIDYYFKYFNLHPYIYVAYNRYSYFYNDLRITFDKKLRSRFNNLDLNDGNDKYFFDSNKYIMEVKSTGALPLWFVNILSEYHIYPKSFSKVGAIYQKERMMKLC